MHVLRHLHIWLLCHSRNWQNNQQGNQGCL